MSLEPEHTSIAVISGGKSKEREISLASGKAVAKALKDAGFSVLKVDPASRNDLAMLLSSDIDVAFLALHGKGGEDGTIQGFLEIAGIPYTGSGVWSSSTAIDKAKTKELYVKGGIPTPASVVLDDPRQHSPHELLRILGEDCVIKAATEGSALGVYICHSEDDVRDALEKVFEIDTVAIGESFVSGDEFTCAVLGTNESARALPLIQIIPANDFYDFESKYAKGGSQHLCPAPISEEDAHIAQELAEKAHRVLGCKGVSRTDLIRDEAGRFWVLETNTIPGMTETSLLPDAARAEGMDFTQLCVALLEEALA